MAKAGSSSLSYPKAKGWEKAGSHPQDYECGVDKTTARDGTACGTMICTAKKPGGFGCLMQMFEAVNYKGKKLKLTAWVKSKDVTDWAGLWMRIDGPDVNQYAYFDNMYDRPIAGTTQWQPYDIVLDVSPNATAIAFGILLNGGGQVWVDDFSFEVVPGDVSTTSKAKDLLKKEPQNLSFEE